MGSAWSDGLEHGKEAIDKFYSPLFYTAPEWDLNEFAHELAVLTALMATYPFTELGEVREAPFIHKGPGYEDRGQLDGLKPKGKRVVLKENKLFARFGAKEAEKLEFDEQLDSYVTALVDGEVEGYGPVQLEDIDIEYNVTLKPALRQGVKETRQNYTARCVADIYARPDHYHKQYRPTRTHEQLQDFRERRDKHVMDLLYEEKMGVWERNPSACFDYGQCPFLKICRTPHIEGIPEGYRKKEERT